MTLRILIADDEAPARRKMARLLDAMDDVLVVGEATSGAEAVERIDSLAPDLVLLDIQMPLLDGFDVIATVGVDAMPAVVFVTAYDEYALRAFDVRALDYLLKPVVPDRLRDAIERARSQCARAPGNSKGVTAQRTADFATLIAGRHLRRLLVHDDAGAQLLPVDAIELARAERNYVALHTAAGTFRIRGTIAALAERLDPAAFLRVNRSDIVKLDTIKELQPWSHGDYRIVLRDNTALLWSRRFRAQTAGDFELS
ncbi:MAG: LytTR family DNA-binding domain-containing protein [bacterium]